jgi:hypothetical protein
VAGLRFGSCGLRFATFHGAAFPVPRLSGLKVARAKVVGNTVQYVLGGAAAGPSEVDWGNKKDADAAPLNGSFPEKQHSK